MSESSGKGRSDDAVYHSDPSHLKDVVDDLEQRVEDEREDADVPGSAGDREEAKPVETGDEAPD
ncbi:MAG: hypothetical protein ICV72_10900 [Aldersonia sp.]|jgi:hypothetical protein|nr:hypothetical protein [Aldersonia sp.]